MDQVLAREFSVVDWMRRNQNFHIIEIIFENI